jgi:ribosome-associated protein
MKNEPLMLLNAIAQTIFDKKGINILALDVQGISSITDYVVIAEGTVDRHVKAIASAIEQALKELQEKPAAIEGKAEGDWIVLDYQQIMVHLFMPGMRDKYRLEELWKAGEIVDLKIVVNQ